MLSVRCSTHHRLSISYRLFIHYKIDGNLNVNETLKGAEVNGLNEHHFLRDRLDVSIHWLDLVFTHDTC